jgi:hypothetical protein
MNSLRLIHGGRAVSAAVSVSGPELRPDAARNQRWDELLALAEESWCWRDPDSLTALAQAVAAMRCDVLREWNEQS